MAHIGDHAWLKRIVDGFPPAYHNDDVLAEIFGVDGLIVVIFVLLIVVALVAVITSAFRSRD